MADVRWEDVRSGAALKFTMWLANLIRHGILGDSSPTKARVSVLGGKYRGFVIVNGLVFKYRAGEDVKGDGTKVYTIQLRYEQPGQEHADVLTIEVPVDQVPR